MPPLKEEIFSIADCSNLSESGSRGDPSFAILKFMNNTLASILLLTLALSSLVPAVAQETFPPNNARLLALNPRVTLRWPGQAKERFYLQIYASQTEIVSQEVTGPGVTLELKPGPLYRWQVSKNSGSGYTEHVPLQSFQLSSDVVFQFSGKAGRPGADGYPGGRTSASGGPGGRGEDGGSGSDVVVNLNRNGEYIDLEVASLSHTQRFILLPQTPIEIVTQGGPGGHGGHGGAGIPGALFLRENRYFVQAESYAAGSGGHGGDGGAGGRGGKVVIRSQGVDASGLVRVSNQGGAGGRGGLPGPGGAVPLVPNYVVGPVPAYYLAPAPPGLPGRNGSSGQAGPVTQ